MRAVFHKLAFATLLCSAGTAMAATALTQTVTATPGAASATPFSVSSTGGGPQVTGVTSTVLIAPVALSQFNPNTGILLGARVSATIPVTVTTQVTAVNSLGSNNRRVDGTTTYTGGISATGVVANSPAAAITLSHDCTGGNCLNSPGNNSRTSAATTYSASGTVASGSLASYYGTGASAVEIATAGTLQVSTLTGSNLGTGTTLGIVNRQADSSYSVAYDYLNFAKPSFSGSSVLNTTTLNFGDRVRNSAPVVLTFTLFNIGDNNSAGFDLLSVTNTNTLFTTTLLPFSGAAGNIDGGQSRTFSVTLTPPSTLGAQVDNFRLLLKDSAVDVGDGIGAREYELSFNTSAFIVLPEPGTWASMIIGFGFIGAAARRRRGAAIRA